MKSIDTFAPTAIAVRNASEKVQSMRGMSNLIAEHDCAIFYFTGATVTI